MESKTVTEMSFLRAPFPVDLIESGLRQKTSVLCVAKDQSKVFIAVKIVQEIQRKSLPGKTAVVISENIKGNFVSEFTRAVDLQTDLKRTTVENTRNKTSISDVDIIGTNVLITTPPDAMYIFESGTVSVDKVNLVILDDCYRMSHDGHPYSTVINMLRSHDHISLPIIIGLSSELSFTSPVLLENMLETMESVFGCRCSVSNDLFAMNRFGEQPHEKVIKSSFLPDKSNGKIQQLSNILAPILSKLALIDLDSQLRSVQIQCQLCIKILGCFGATAAVYHARLIIREISKLKKKLVDESEHQTLLFCETQLKLILQYDKNDQLPDISPLVRNIILSLSYLKPGISIDSTCKVTSNPNSGCHGDNMVSIILCCSDQEAAVLNFMINKLAKSDPELGFLHCRYISSSVIKQSDMNTGIDPEGARKEDIVRLIKDRQVNVLVISQEAENDIHLGQCKQVIRFGLPEDYQSYVRVKKIPRMAQGEVVIIESEEKWMKGCSTRYNVFTELEGILACRCQSYQPAINSEKVTVDVSNNELCGEDEPFVEPRFAISLINRYCRAFPNDGLSFPLPRCQVKVLKEDDQFRVVSILYLPRHSPVFWPFKGIVTIPLVRATPDGLAEARIKSMIHAAQLACKALRDVDEMNDQLQPTIRQTNFTLKKADEKCASEVVDGGLGVDGSAKRQRAYQKKFADILMNNLVVAGESVYVYSISITVNHHAACESEERSYHVPSTDISDISLGFLSRNRLPKVPKFLLYSRPGELNVSITECADKAILTPEELALIQRFHQYVYTNIININGDTGEQCFEFKPDEQSFGCYLVLLSNAGLPVQSSEQRSARHYNVTEINKEGSCVKGSADGSSLIDQPDLQNLTLGSCKKSVATGDVKESTSSLNERIWDKTHDNVTKKLRIAFDFLEDLEQQLGDLLSPQYPPSAEIRNFELFRNRVVTATYMAKPTNYFVADILYDKTPLSPFSDPSVAATFADYYKQKYDIDLYKDQPLLCMDHITKRLNLLLPRHKDNRGKDLPLPDKNSKRSQRSQIILMPELCSIHPISAPLWQEMLYLPSIFYRLECILVAEELRQLIAVHTGIGDVKYSEDLPRIAFGESVGENHSEGSFMLENFKQGKKEVIEGARNYPGPSSTLLLRALTCLGARDAFSHERLEIYGDSLIKHSVSLNLYCESPFFNVSQLSLLRGQRVSNKQLFYLGCALDLPSYIHNVDFRPLVNWHPHGFVALSSAKTEGRYLELNASAQDIDLSDIEDEKSENEEAAHEKHGPVVLIDGQNHVVASDKTVADTIEAIIGAYLVTCSFNDTLQVMKWIGLDIKTKDIICTSPTKSLSECKQEEKTFETEDEFFDSSHKECLEVEFKEVEEVLGYTFKDKLLLLQAFTHASYPRDFNHVHSSYEHLEFLGDAVLDYLITRHLYYTQPSMSPGALTDLRSAVVNSYSFAFLAVKYGLHRHLRSLSPTVFRIVNKFLMAQEDMMTKKMKENPNQIFTSVFLPMENKDESKEGIEVPKVLADLFESVIGAIFVDVGQDEEKTWGVVYPLLQATIEHYSKHLPKSPVRQLQEEFPDSVSVVSMDCSIAGKHTCTLEVKGQGKFKGTGRSAKIARSTAAQRALACIQTRHEKSTTTKT